MEYRVIENVNYSTLSYFYALKVVLPIGSRLIINDIEYEIVSYINRGRDYYIVVRRTTNHDIQYLDKIM